MKSIAMLWVLVAMSVTLPEIAGAQAASTDRRLPVRVMLGSWQGVAQLAAPGKEFQLYSHNHFRRSKE